MRLVVRFGALCFNILLNAVNLGLIADQALLDIVKSVVNIRLQNLVLAGVVLHSVVSSLLSKLGLVLLN